MLNILVLLEVEGLVDRNFVVLMKLTVIYVQFYNYIFQVRCFISHTLIPNCSLCKWTRNMKLKIYFILFYPEYAFLLFLKYSYANNRNRLHYLL
jgi:hypothetical protein